MAWFHGWKMTMMRGILFSWVLWVASSSTTFEPIGQFHSRGDCKFGLLDLMLQWEQRKILSPGAKAPLAFVCLPSTVDLRTSLLPDLLDPVDMRIDP